MNKDHLNFQRKVLGILCALLAPSCMLLGLFGKTTNPPMWYDSISATYYANSKICMIGLLFTTAVFFLTYKGYDSKDTELAWVQGISALGIIVFPCFNPGVPDHVGLFQLPINISNSIHLSFASILFLSFATMITFLFTKGNKTNLQKAKRNKVYYTCGIIIYAVMVFQLLAFLFIMKALPVYIPITLIDEAIMLTAFSIAWLTKAECFKLLNDKE